jgi:electron transport complex protein RnfG
MTAARIENQVLLNVEGPKVKLVLKGAENNLLADRKKVDVNGKQFLVFIGKQNDKPWAIAYETLGTGFGGELKVMVGYDVHTNKLTGIQIISNQETPGVGSRVTQSQFTDRFQGLAIGTDFALKADGGAIDGISGATYSSRGVCEAIRKSIELYPQVKKEVLAS